MEIVPVANDITTWPAGSNCLQLSSVLRSFTSRFWLLSFCNLCFCTVLSPFQVIWFSNKNYVTSILSGIILRLLLLQTKIHLDKLWCYHILILSKMAVNPTNICYINCEFLTSKSHLLFIYLCHSWERIVFEHKKKQKKNKKLSYGLIVSPLDGEKHHFFPRRSTNGCLCDTCLNYN